MERISRHDMRSWIAVSSRWLIVFAASAGVSACIATSSPRIRACAATGSAAASGSLRILPSRVPGVEIDSAYWATFAGLEDIGTHEGLTYHSRLRATRAVRRNELAILYDGTGPRAVVDPYAPSVMPLDHEIVLTRDDRFDLSAGDTTTTVRNQIRGGGFRMGKWSSFDYCPSTVQLVERRDLPFILMPRLASDSVRRVATSSVDARRSPLVVIGDTMVAADAYGNTTLIGAAINVADTALADMIVALVVDRREPADSTHEALTVEDTVEYHVGPVAPRGRVGFIGGSPWGGTIVDHFTFPAARLAGSHLLRIGGVTTSNERRRGDAERIGDAERERTRTREVLWTDSTRYVARRSREVTPGVFEYELTIVARWTNRTTTPLYLARCGAGDAPAYAITHQLAAQGERSAYAPVPPCSGTSRAIRVAPDSARVDTLHFRALRSARLTIEQELAEPRIDGRFLLSIDVLQCEAAASNCQRIETPYSPPLGRSRPFTVRVDRRSRPE